MELLTEKNCTGLGPGDIVHPAVLQGPSGHGKTCDVYPDPDDAHTFSHSKEQDFSTSQAEGGSVLRLFPSHGSEITSSESGGQRTEADDGSGSGLPGLSLENDVCKAVPPPASSGCDTGSSLVSNGRCQVGSIPEHAPQLSQNSSSETVPSQAQRNRIDSNAGESEDVVTETITMSSSSSQKGKPRGHRPGVILLGRGNSFSLGRSEVIFLHHTRPPKPRAGSKASVVNGKQGLSSCTSTQPSPSAAASEDSCVSHSAASPAADETRTANIVGPSPPPPLSNQNFTHSTANSLDSINENLLGFHSDSVNDGLPRPITFTSGKTTAEGKEPLNFETFPSIFTTTNSDRGSAYIFDKNSSRRDSDELEALWARAELVMKAKQKAVLDVLAQFGVGGGAGGEDSDRLEEEEEEEEDGVWRVVEGKAHVVER